MAEEIANFVDANHALAAGFMVGLMMRHGISAVPTLDKAGNYTAVITITHDSMSRPVRIQVLPDA